MVGIQPDRHEPNELNEGEVNALKACSAELELLLTDKPRRRWEILVRVGADSWQDVQRSLEEIADWAIRDHDGTRPVCMWTGGPDAGCYITGSEDPTATHESYFEAIARGPQVKSAPGCVDCGALRPGYIPESVGELPWAYRCGCDGAGLRLSWFGCGPSEERGTDG